tara:strand:+ start:2896 stop:3474 length:579 start_codon:yes stop_codon:yes gene_type:complete
MQLEDKKALLKKFSKLVIEANHKHNLTAYKHHETFYKEQINDCLKAKEVCLKVCEKTIVDYGSGAGLPGLVWAVVDQNLKLVNVDSNLKKVEFQKNLIRKLLIKNTICCHLRMEEHDIQEKHTAVFKAFSTIKKTLEKIKQNKLRTNLMFLKKNNEKTQEEILEAKPLLYDYKIHPYKSNLGNMCVVEVYDN